MELGLVGFSQADIIRRIGELPQDILPITTGQYGSLAIRIAPLDYKAPLTPQIVALDEAFAAMQRLTRYAAFFT